MRFETFELEAESFCAGEIDNRNDESEDLTGNGRPSGTLDAPVEDENENRVKDDIRHGTSNGCNHSEGRGAVGTNDGVEHVAEHINREEGEDNIEILLGIEQVVSASAKEAENLIGKNETERDKDKTD